MIVLSEVTDSLQVVLGGAVATNQLHCVAAWRDRSSGPPATFGAGRTVAQTNNTIDVDIVPAPASGVQRVIDFISVYNADTDERTVAIKFSDNGTDYIIWKDTLLRFASRSELLFFLILPIVFTFILAGGTGAPADNRIHLLVADQAGSPLSQQIIADWRNRSRCGLKW